jgi:hypothetical protein
MMSYAEFRRLVSEMMDAQKRYFAVKDNLAECKRLERRVRDELAGRPAGEGPGLFDASEGEG